MASVAVTNITKVNYDNSKKSISGFPVETYRIASGQAAADTAVIPNSNAPTLERGLIKAVSGGPFSHNLPATGATNVTITLVGGTTTIGQFDVEVTWGPR